MTTHDVIGPPPAFQAVIGKGGLYGEVQLNKSEHNGGPSGPELGAGSVPVW